MAHFFDEVRAIVLNKGTKKEKIERLQKELKVTRYEAETFYAQLSPVLSIIRATTTRPAGAKLRFTMGVEIECFGIDRYAIKAAIERRGLKSHITGYDHRDSKDSYKLGYDSSISGADSCEVVSPILKSLNSLETVCQVINEAGAQVNKSCGLHVHLGAEKFTLEQWCRIILNYAAIEGVIDSFMSRSRRGDNNGYCMTIRGNIETNIYAIYENLRRGGHHTMSDIQEAFDNDRYHKVNPMAYNSHKTIEFRQHGGTTDYEKIKNWIGFLTALVSWSINHDELLTGCNTIDDLPFLNRAQKKFYNGRKSHFEIFG